MFSFAITEDHISEGNERNDKGTIGPRNTTLTFDEIVNHPDGKVFKMFDDDEILYYTGVMIEDEDSSGFEPLECFGMPNAGATSIHYLENGKFIEL